MAGSETVREIQPGPTTSSRLHASEPSGRTSRRRTAARRTTLAERTFDSPTPSPFGESTAVPSAGA